MKNVAYSVVRFWSWLNKPLDKRGQRKQEIFVLIIFALTLLVMIAAALFGVNGYFTDKPNIFVG